jgi:hypothetical protein
MFETLFEWRAFIWRAVELRFLTLNLLDEKFRKPKMAVLVRYYYRYRFMPRMLLCCYFFNRVVISFEILLLLRAFLCRALEIRRGLKVLETQHINARMIHYGPAMFGIVWFNRSRLRTKRFVENIRASPSHESLQCQVIVFPKSAALVFYRLFVYIFQ